MNFIREEGGGRGEYPTSKLFNNLECMNDLTGGEKIIFNTMKSFLKIKKYLFTCLM